MLSADCGGISANPRVGGCTVVDCVVGGWAPSARDSNGLDALDFTRLPAFAISVVTVDSKGWVSGGGLEALSETVKEGYVHHVGKGQAVFRGRGP